MALEKTRTPGIYKFIGKNGKARYRLVLTLQVPDWTQPSGFRWKSKVMTFNREKEAIDAKIKTASEVKSGNYVEPTNKSVLDLLTAWLETAKRDGVTKRGPWKMQTYLFHKTHIDNHIGPILGPMKASALKKRIIEQATAKWEQDTSAETANKILGTLGAAFKFAIKDPDTFGVRSNPVDSVTRRVDRMTPEEIEALALGEIPDIGQDHPETKRGTLRAIRPDEVHSALELRQILEAASPGLEKVLFMTAILTGLRHGELNGLRWSMIDLKRGVLTVTRSLTQLSKKLGGSVLEPPKTRNAYRRLQLPAPLLAELRRWKIACPPTPNEFVFVSPMGRPATRKQNNERFQACCERAEVSVLAMNNLRHSYASQQLLNGTPPLEVSYLMGHSSPAVTLSIYSHWTKNEKSDSQKRLADRILQAAESTGNRAFPVAAFKLPTEDKQWMPQLSVQWPPSSGRLLAAPPDPSEQ